MSTDSSLTSVKVRADGACGTILLSGKARRNALSASTLEDLRQAFADLHQQKSVRAVMLTGDGDCFCAGTDLLEIESAQQEESPHLAWFADVASLRELLVTMMQFPKPILAAVNGPALGSGLGLVAACDLVLAAPEARFAMPEAQHGLTAGPSIPLLAFRLGASRAAQLVLGDQTWTAEQAAQAGLVHEISSFEFLWARGRQWADQIAQGSASALAMNKRLLNETVGEQLSTQISATVASLAATRTTDDARIGVRAFLAKTPPAWEA